MEVPRRRLRLGVIFEPNTNAFYRAIEPMKAMERRGHEVIWQDQEASADPRRFVDCDLLHVYRCSTANTYPTLRKQVYQGLPITYDNDDNVAHTPVETPGYESVGARGWEAVFADSVRVARLARITTTPSEALAAEYRQAGVKRVEVVANYLAPDVDRRKRAHDGVVIGWIAAGEHQADAVQLGIADTLRRVLAKHRKARVECIGIDLGLPERYRREARVPFPDLPSRIAGFDIGIAPLADIPFNRTRSDIKLKEYAASGIPWIASPVGPYRGYGADQGGILVSDDGWLDALDDLVSNSKRRLQLGQNALAWAQGQTMDVAADQWERLFTEAARR